MLVREEPQNQDNLTSSSALTITDDLGHPHPFTTSYIPDPQNIRIGERGPPAIENQYKTFLEMTPICLWYACSQPHVLYYIVQSGFQYFKYCEVQEPGEYLSTVLHFVFAAIIILFELYFKYATYYNFTVKYREKQNKVQYSTWNKDLQNWEYTRHEHLREGQIIKVERFLSSDPRINPTTILPLAYSSKNRSILIKTTRIDKKEQYKKVVILKPFVGKVRLENQYHNTSFNPALFQMKINYVFISEFGETFEAQLTTGGGRENSSANSLIFTNEDIIPGGVGITTQDFVIGIVLKQMGEDYSKNLSTALSKRNNITKTLSYHLFNSIVLNVGILFVVYTASIIALALTTGPDLDEIMAELSYCYMLHFIPVFMNAVYISLYMFLYIYRLKDKVYLRQDMALNVFDRSIDELAQVDTLVMDDFFFIEREFSNQDFRCKINQQAPLAHNMDLVLRLMQGSTVLKEYMAGHIIPITKYFRLNPVFAPRSQSKVRILKETVMSQSCIQLKIKVMSQLGHDQFYAIRFNNEPVKSTTAKLQNKELKEQIQDIIEDYRTNMLLLFYIEIVRLDSDLQNSNQLYILHSIISFSENFDSNIVEMLKDQLLVNKFNIVLLTNKTRNYIEYFLDKSKMRTYRDSVIILDQKEEGKINQIIKDQRTSIKNQSRQSKNYNKHKLLFLSSTMITYLSRRTIRRSLSRLAKYCKYIVFFNCSQFEKQMCTVNLFRIFENHLYLSNYQCDHPIFQRANLSISQADSTAEKLTTFTISRYDKLPSIMLRHCFQSMQVVNSIVTSHVFRNMFLMGGDLMAFYLVFRGGFISLMDSYLVQIFYFYNFLFTLAPLLYQFGTTRQRYLEKDIRKYIEPTYLLVLSIKGFLFGMLTGLFAYCLIVDQFVCNLFWIILLTAIIVSNLFYLYIDNLKSKGWLLFWIILQIVVSGCFVLVVQLFNTKTFNIVTIDINFDPVLRWNYLATYLIVPLFAILLLYASSIGREIVLEQDNRRPISLEELVDNQALPSTFDLTSDPHTQQEVIKIVNHPGKQITFDDTEN